LSPDAMSLPIRTLSRTDGQSAGDDLPKARRFDRGQRGRLSA
jgi:hypothetical protein